MSLLALGGVPLAVIAVWLLVKFIEYWRRGYPLLQPLGEAPPLR